MVLDAGNAFELARTMLVVVVSVKAVARVLVASPFTTPPNKPELQPKPDFCVAGPTV